MFSSNLIKDYYKILEIDSKATTEEIKKSFRGKSLECHPDKNMLKSPEEQDKAKVKFQSLSEAYGVLSDNEKRREYDSIVLMYKLFQNFNSPIISQAPQQPAQDLGNINFNSGSEENHNNNSSNNNEDVQSEVEFEDFQDGILSPNEKKSGY